MITVFLLILAIAPGVVIAMYIYMVDIRAPEPISTLSQCVFYGVLSFFISIGIGSLLQTYSLIEDDNIIHQMIRAIVFVGLVEEGSKFLFLSGILFRNPNFDQPFDAIVYSVMIGMGFATAENILYVINGDGGTALVRAVTAVPAHALFAVIMGFFIGEAKVFKSSSMLFSCLALFFASLVHGYYDYFIFLKFIPGVWQQAIISLGIMIGITHYAFRLRKDEIIIPDK